MGFYNNYPNRKDRRKPYHDGRSCDQTCKNNRTCKRCNDKRQFFDRKYREVAEDKLKEYYKEVLEDELDTD